jgi:hypothetical protein
MRLDVFDIHGCREKKVDWFFLDLSAYCRCFTDLSFAHSEMHTAIERLYHKDQGICNMEALAISELNRLKHFRLLEVLRNPRASLLKTLMH